MDIREIGNELLRQQTLYEQSLKQSEVAVAEINEKLKTITPEQIQVCLECGVDLSPILNADLERMKHDSDYRESMCDLQNKTCTTLINILEKGLCLE